MGAIHDQLRTDTGEVYDEAQRRYESLADVSAVELQGNQLPSSPSDGELLRYNGTQWEHVGSDWVGADELDLTTTPVWENNHKWKPTIRERGRVNDATNLNSPHDVQVEDGYAYVAGKGGTFAVVDISHVDEPEVIGSITTGVSNAETVQVTGGHIVYVGTDDGLIVTDVSDPSAPSIIKTVSGTSSVNGMSMWRHYLFAASKTGSVDLFDISDPTSPSKVGSYDARGNDGIQEPHDIDFTQGYLAVPNQNDGDATKLALIDVVDESTGQLKAISSWSASSTFGNSNANGANRVIVRGRYCYMTNNISGTLSVLDFSDPSSISQVANISLQGASNGIALMGRWLMAAIGTDLEVVDIEDPENPSSVLTHEGASIDHDLEVWGDIVVGTAQGADRLSVMEVAAVRVGGLDAGGVRADSLFVDDYARMKDLNVGGALHVAGNPVITTDPIFVDRSDRQVGVNTTSPLDEFHVSGNSRVSGTTPQINLNETGAGAPAIQFFNGGTREWQIQHDTGTKLRFRDRVNGKEVMNLFLGTSPTVDLVDSDLSIGGGALTLDPSSGNAVITKSGTGGADIEIDGNGNILLRQGNLRVGDNTAPTNPVEVVLATENLDIVDAGSTGATQQDWIEVNVGGNQGFIRVFASK